MPQTQKVVGNGTLEQPPQGMDAHAQVSGGGGTVKAGEVTAEATQPKHRLSAYQMSEARSNFRELQEKLASARDAEQETRERLLEVINQETKAQRSLSATEGVAGYANERARAAEALAHCAEVQPQLERGAEARRRQVKQLEAALHKIDKSTFAQCLSPLSDVLSFESQLNPRCQVCLGKILPAARA